MEAAEHRRDELVGVLVDMQVSLPLAEQALAEEAQMPFAEEALASLAFALENRLESSADPAFVLDSTATEEVAGIDQADTDTEQVDIDQADTDTEQVDTVQPDTDLPDIELADIEQPDTGHTGIPQGRQLHAGVLGAASNWQVNIQTHFRPVDRLSVPSSFSSSSLRKSRACLCTSVRALENWLF